MSRSDPRSVRNCPSTYWSKGADSDSSVALPPAPLLRSSHRVPSDGEKKPETAAPGREPESMLCAAGG